MTNTKTTEVHLFDPADLADPDPLMGAIREQLDLELDVRPHRHQPAPTTQMHDRSK